MRKILSLALALALCVSVVAGLASCKHEHEYKTEWSKDATHHWHDCEGCEEPGDKAAHTMGTDWQKDADNHWHLCSVCGEIGDKAAHNWGTATKVSHGVYTSTCADCGQTKTDNKDVEVTEAEFGAAFDLGENYIGSVSATHPDPTEGFYTISVKRDANKFENYSAFSTPDYSYDSTDYIAIEDGKCCYYSAVTDSDGEVIGYEKYVSEDEDPAELIAEIAAQFLPEDMNSYSLYTYNPETKLYEAETVTITSMGGFEVSNVKLGFEDGRIVSFTYEMELEEGVIVPYIATFSYGDASVTIPTPMEPAETEVTEAEFDAAFDLGDNYTVTVFGDHPTQGTMQMIVSREDGEFENVQTVTPPDGEVQITINYSSIEGDKLYNYSLSGTEYIKEEVTGITPAEAEAMVVEQFLPTEMRSYDIFSYNPDTECYECESLVIASMGGSEVQNLALAFEDGKIVALSYQMSISDNIVNYFMTFTYGDASVTLPEVAPAE